MSEKSWKLGVARLKIGGREGPRHLPGGVASLFRESGGRSGLRAVLWSWIFLGGASSVLNVVYCLGKVDLVPGSTDHDTPDYTQQSWPSSRPTLRRMIVFLSTTTSSAQTFSSELKQGTRERSGVGGHRGQNESAVGCDSTEDRFSVPYSWAFIDLKFLGVLEGWDERLKEEACSLLKTCLTW